MSALSAIDEIAALRAADAKQMAELIKTAQNDRPDQTRSNQIKIE